MQVVRGENESMMRLVEDLLTLARLDAGRAPCAWSRSTWATWRWR